MDMTYIEATRARREAERLALIGEIHNLAHPGRLIDCEACDERELDTRPLDEIIARLDDSIAEASR